VDPSRPRVISKAVGGPTLERPENVTGRKRAAEKRDRLLARAWDARAWDEERKRISRELHDRVVAHAMVVVHQSLELYEALKRGDPEAAGAKLCLARETTKQAMNLTRALLRAAFPTPCRAS